MCARCSIAYMFYDVCMGMTLWKYEHCVLMCCLYDSVFHYKWMLCIVKLCYQGVCYNDQSCHLSYDISLNVTHSLIQLDLWLLVFKQVENYHSNRISKNNFWCSLLFFVFKFHYGWGLHATSLLLTQCHLQAIKKLFHCNCFKNQIIYLVMLVSLFA